MSFGVKGGSILVGLILVPLLIDYVSPAEYGIWLTISSFVSWMSFFDIGMGNGLRNKLTAAIANDQVQEARTYISTTYAVLAIISAVLLLIFLVANRYINWNQVLNIPVDIKDDFRHIFFIVFASFSVQFVLQIIVTILTAIHKSALAGLVSFLGQLGVLFAIMMVKRWVPGDLTIMVLMLTIIPLFVFAFASVVLFSGKLRHLSPAIRLVKFQYARQILNIGTSFLVIQIGAVVLFQTDNIIISRIIGPEAVTGFNIAYRLFSVVMMAFTILMTPYWSAFAEAFTRNDFDWMKRSIRKVRKIWFVIAFIIIPALALCAGLIYRLWIGDHVEIDMALTISVALYAIAYTGMALNSYFLNGLGKVEIQKYLYIIACTVNVPLSIYLTHRIGVHGAVLANVAVLTAMMCILWIQSNRLLSGNATGLWNR
ncbi:lipopolysaccharide biosynthesis protein [Pedobacter yulinensis]|nr:MATE family efflux transporter [Pedobacter yulinensis]